MDQLPRLGKRELICLLLFTCNYVVSVWRGFLFLWVLGMGYVILLWHSLSLQYNYCENRLSVQKPVSRKTHTTLYQICFSLCCYTYRVLQKPKRDVRKKGLNILSLAADLLKLFNPESETAFLSPNFMVE